MTCDEFSLLTIDCIFLLPQIDRYSLAVVRLPERVPGRLRASVLPYDPRRRLRKITERNLVACDPPVLLSLECSRSRVMLLLFLLLLLLLLLFLKLSEAVNPFHAGTCAWALSRLFSLDSYRSLRFSLALLCSD